MPYTCGSARNLTLIGCPLAALVVQTRAAELYFGPSIWQKPLHPLERSIGGVGSVHITRIPVGISISVSHPQQQQRCLCV